MSDRWKDHESQLIDHLLFYVYQFLIFWKEIKYANQKLLVLDDVLELIARSSKGLMIEVKQPQQYLDIENILILICIFDFFPKTVIILL